MKKQLFFYTILALCFCMACDAKLGIKPKIGDAVFYDYVIEQGDSIVYQAIKQAEDTAFMIIEQSSEPTQKILVEKLISLSVNDSMTFAIDKQRTGYLRLHRIITAAEFPKYIEEAQKKEQIFEQRLQEISKELSAAVPFFKSRQKAVIDSTLAFNDQFKKGLLNAQFKQLPDSCFYFVVKGGESPRKAKRKWLWFHCSTVLPNGKMVNTYHALPRGTNVGEFAFNEQIERTAAKFEEGSIIVMTVPTKLMNMSGTAVKTELDGATLFWIEIAKVLEL